MTDYVVSDTTLTSVADAIREKGGTSAPLEWPQGYIDAVGDISTQPVSVPSKDVDFYDYDGTRVYSYTAAEFLALEEMPANPDHSHDDVPLTSQGWNWSFSDAQAYVRDYGMLDVGQMYVPTDGATHIVIQVPDDVPSSGRVFVIRFQQSASRGVTVDWGDGTETETYTGTSDSEHAHTYSTAGEYDIKIKATSGTVTFTGANANNYSMFGTNTADYRYRQMYVQKVFFGPVTSIPDGAFRYNLMFRLITLPNTVVSFGNDVFRQCRALKAVIIPINTTASGSLFSIDTWAEIVVCLNKTIPLSTALKERIMTAKQIVPINGDTVGQNAFMDNKAATRLSIPNGITTLSSGCFSGNAMLRQIIVPSTVTSIAATAFADCVSVREYHMRPTTPPTLANTNAFSNMPPICVIYVPRGKLNTYKTATNWSTYASYMQEEPS